MRTLSILSTLGVIALAGCASPTPPSISAADVTAINDKFETLSGLPDTAIADLPPGSASFTGHAGGSITGDADGDVVGDMVMNVNFKDNTIDGAIDNMNLVDDDGIPEQLLGGSLAISGVEADGSLTATAAGTLTAVGDERVRGSSDVTLYMNGNVLTENTAGDTVTGEMTGSGTGDFDINMTEGGFFGQSN